jgi:hypothetical protein
VESVLSGPQPHRQVTVELRRDQALRYGQGVDERCELDGHNWFLASHHAGISDLI